MFRASHWLWEQGAAGRHFAAPCIVPQVFRVLRSPPWSGTGLSWNLSHCLGKRSFVLTKDTALSRLVVREMLESQGRRQGSYAQKLICKNICTGDNTKSRERRKDLQSPGQCSWGEHSPSTSCHWGRYYSWRSSDAGPHSLPCTQTTLLAPADSLPVGEL